MGSKRSRIRKTKRDFPKSPLPTPGGISKGSNGKKKSK